MIPHEHIGKKFRLVLVGLMVGLLISCTSTLAYRYADWLVVWKLDQYFDLTRDQKTFLRGRLQELLARHRKEALPLYETFLTQIKDKSSDGLTREEVEWIFAVYQDLRRDLFERIVADGATFLASVNEQQIRHLAQVFRKENDTVEKRLKGSSEKHLSDRATATLDWLKDWLGPLTAEQKQQISQLSRNLPDMQAMRLDHERLRQQDALLMLRSTRNIEILAQSLRNWLLFPERSAPLEYQHAAERLRNAVKEMILSVDGMVTQKQRAHALAELQGLIDDVHALAAS
jgi:hypothetical protein